MCLQRFFSFALLDDNSPSLGWRRNVLLVEALNSPDSGRIVHHTTALKTLCSRSGVRLSTLTGTSNSSKAMAGTSVSSPFTSPMFTGSFPSSPLLYSPDVVQRIGRIDLVPPMCLNDHEPLRLTSSPPKSSPGPRQLSLPVQSLSNKLKSSPQAGIVHLALQSDTMGSVIRLMPLTYFII